MRRIKRRVRNLEVERTGLIPAGSDVHFRHLHNPSIGYLLRVIRQTELLISTGECHADWGRKRIEALQNMLETKEVRLRKRRA